MILSMVKPSGRMRGVASRYGTRIDSRVYALCGMSTKDAKQVCVGIAKDLPEGSSVSLIWEAQGKLESFGFGPDCIRVTEGF